MSCRIGEAFNVSNGQWLTMKIKLFIFKGLSLLFGVHLMHPG